MNFDEMINIFKAEGTKYNFKYSESELQEVSNNPESNIDFIKYDNCGWIVGGTSNERGKLTVSAEECFDDFNKAINRFFLKKLHTHYILEKLPVMEKETGIGQSCIEGTLDFIKFSKVIDSLKISKCYLSVDSKTKNSIFVEKIDNLWITGYIDSKGNRHRTTKPLSLSQCLWLAFRRIILLLWLDEVSKKYFNEIDSSKVFSGIEIAAYL